MILPLDNEFDFIAIFNLILLVCHLFDYSDQMGLIINVLDANSNGIKDLTKYHGRDERERNVVLTGEILDIKFIVKFSSHQCSLIIAGSLWIMVDHSRSW